MTGLPSDSFQYLCQILLRFNKAIPTLGTPATFLSIISNHKTNHATTFTLSHLIVFLHSLNYLSTRPQYEISTENSPLPSKKQNPNTALTVYTRRPSFDPRIWSSSSSADSLPREIPVGVFPGRLVISVVGSCRRLQSPRRSFCP